MNIKNLASDVIFKLTLGIVLAGSMIISMVYFAGAFHDYLNEFTNARTLELISFGIIFTVAAAGMYFVLRNNSSSRRSLSDAQDKLNFPITVDFQVLAFKFIEGYMEGLLKRSPPPSSYSTRTYSDENSAYKEFDI